ncbi:hypothetical protein HYV84_04125 [Candidatus Woesearchaeota archaeon]|nr:hypothetical protein [Candidatus Woesearchaeota archaeon]
MKSLIEMRMKGFEAVEKVAQANQRMSLSTTFMILLLKMINLRKQKKLLKKSFASTKIPILPLLQTSI